ncbi:MAG: hypothetical protein KFF73_15510 [Cyclobacteriaceae bacterium]|nr:hypothetical protein [Cyclobacteriaceae bacterium]
MKNTSPLTRKSKANDIQYFNLSLAQVNFRYIKIVGPNRGEVPVGHHGAGEPS